MTDFPEDIMKKARDISLETIRASSLDDLKTGLALLIARAIQAERRRCDCIVRRSDIATMQKSEAILKGEQP